MSCTPTLFDKRPLKKPKLGPPDIYPQDIKQKEDDLSALNVKQGYYEHFNNIDEYGSNKSLKILHEALLLSFNNILKRKRDLNTPLDNSKKKLLLNIKDIFWPATARSKVSVDIWFKDLAANKPLNNLAKKVPIFNKKEELIMQLYETNIPIQRACWIIKLHAAHTSVIAENKIKKRQIIDPCYEWTQTFCKILKELAHRLNYLIKKNKDAINEYSKLNLTNNDLEKDDAHTIIGMANYINNTSTYSNSGFVAHQPDQQQQLPNYLTSNLATTFQIWNYLDSLVYYIFKERLLDNQEFTMFLCDLLEKPADKLEVMLTYEELYDSSFDFLLPLVLKYIDCITQSYFCSRRLAFFCAQFLKRYYLKSSLHQLESANEENLNNQSSGTNGYIIKSKTTPDHRDAIRDFQNFDKMLFLIKYHDCPKHRNIILNLSQIIQMITLKCPSALVWNGVWKWSMALNAQNLYQENPACFKNSPLDYLPFTPSELPIQTYDGNAIQLKEILYQMEEGIAKRSSMADHLWSLPYENKNKYFTTTNVINMVIEVLEALDHYDYNKCDKGNDTKHLYQKIYCLNEPYYQDKPFDDNVEMLCKNEEPILNTMCQWAITLQRSGSYRPIVAAHMLGMRLRHLQDILIQNDKLCQRRIAVSAESGTTTAEDNNVLIDEAEREIFYKSQSRLVIQKLLINFLDLYAPTLKDLQDENLELFTSLIILFGEFIRGGIFNYDSYVKFLICRGDVDVSHLQEPLWAHACFNKTKKLLTRNLSKPVDLLSDVSTADFIYPFATTCLTTTTTINDEYEQLLQRQMLLTTTSNLQGSGTGGYFRPNKKTTIFKKNMLFSVHYQYLYHFPVTDQKDDIISRLKALFGISFYKSRVESNLKQLYKLLLVHPVVKKNTTTITTRANKGSPDPGAASDINFSRVQRYLKAIYLTFPICDQWLLSGKCLRSIVKALRKFVISRRHPLDDKVLIVKGHPIPTLGPQQQLLLLPRLETIAFYYDLAACSGNYGAIVTSASDTLLELSNVYRHIACTLATADIPSPDDNKNDSEDLTFFLVDWQFYTVKLAVLLIGHLKLLQPYLVTYSQLDSSNHRVSFSPADTDSNDGGLRQHIATDDTGIHRIFRAILVFCREVGEIPQGACSYFRTLYSFLYDLYVSCSLLRDVSSNKELLENSIALISEIKKSMYSIVAPTPPPPPSFHHQVQAQAAHHQPGGAAGLLLGGGSGGTSQLAAATAASWWDPFFLTPFLRSWSQVNLDEHPNPHSSNGTLLYVSKFDSYGIISSIDRELSSLSSSGGNNCSSSSILLQLEQHPSKRYSFVCNALIALLRRILSETEWLDDKRYLTPICLNGGGGGNIRHALQTPPLPLPSEEILLLPLAKYARVHYRTLRDLRVYVKFAVEISCQYQHPKFLKGGQNEGGDHPATKSLVGGAGLPKSEMTFHERIMTYQTEVGDADDRKLLPPMSLDYLPSSSSFTTTSCIQPAITAGAPLLNGEWLGAFKALCCPTHHMHHQHTLLQHPHHPTLPPSLIGGGAMPESPLPDSPATFTSTTIASLIFGNHNFVTVSRNAIKLFSDTGRLDKLMLLYDCLGVLCLSLILRHIFSLEDFIKHVALPSLLAAACPPAAAPPVISPPLSLPIPQTSPSPISNSNNKDTGPTTETTTSYVRFNRVLKDKPAESGARLTCFLLYRLFKSFPPTYLDGSLTNNNVVAGEGGTNFDPNIPPLSLLPIVKESTFLDIGRTLIEDRSKWLATASTTDLSASIHTAAATAPNTATHPALNLVGEGEDEEEDDDLKTALTGLDDNPVLGVTDEQLVVVEGGNPNEEFKYLGYVAEDMSGDEEDNHKDYLNPALKHTSTTYNNNNNLKGRFTGFNTTPGSSASCFSYTSLFEQLPSTTSKSQINTENKDFPPFAFSSFAGVFQEVYEKQNLLAHQHNISIGALLAVFKALILTSSLQHVTNEGDDPELISESANFGTGAKKRKGGTPRKKNLQQYETTPNYKKTYPYSSSRGSNLYPPHPSSPYAEYEETGEMLSFRFNRFSQEVLLVLTHQPWVKELFLKDPDGICSDQLLLDPLLSHKQASKLLHLICYPEGLPSIPKHFFFHKDHRSEIKSHVARILCNLDPFNLRVSYLELQLAIKQQVREQDLNVLYDVISRVTIQIFQQRNQFTNDNVPIRYRKKSIISLLYRSTSFLDFFPAAAAAAAAAKLNHHNPEYLPAAYHHRQQQQQLKQNNNNNNKSSNKNNLFYLNNNNETDNTSTSTSTTNKNKGKRTASSLNASSTLTSTINSSNKRRKRGRPPLNSAAATCSAPPPPSNVSGHLNEKNKKLGAATTLKNSPKPPTTTAHNAASASTLLTSPFSQSCAAEDFAVSGGQDEDYDSSSSLDSFPFLGSSSGQQYAADDDDDCQPKFNEEDNRLLLLNQEDGDNYGHAALTEYDLAFGAGSGPLSNVTALDGGCFTGGGNYASPLTPAALNSIESSSMTNTNNNNNINDGGNLLLSSSTTNYNNYTSPARKKAAVAANQATLRRWNAEKKRRRKQSVWFVAPLVAKLSKGIQGRVLKYAGQILESGSTQHWATSSLNKLEREKCTQRSASLLTHKPFLFLLKTCLARHKSLFSRRFYRSTYVYHVDGRTETALNAAATELYGTSDQRLYLLAAVHSQIAQILKNANEDRHILLLPENMKARNEIRKGLTLRLSLVADMCDLIIKAFSNVSPLPLGSMNLYAASGGMGSSGVGGGNTSGYNSTYLSSGGGNGTPNSMLGGGGAFGLVDYFGGSGSSAAQLGNNNQLGLDWASLLFQILTNDIVMNNIDGSFLDSEVEESCLLESSSDNDDTGELSSAGEELNCNNSTSLAAMDHNEISLQHTKRIGKSTGTSSAIYPPPIGFNRAVASTSYYRHDNWDRGTDSFNYNENCTRLFYTVFDMLTTVVLASQMNLSFSHQHPPTFTTRRDSENDLENESSDDGGGYTIATGNVNFVQLDDSQKKSYHTFCKKLKKEILDKYESPKGEPLRILFPFGRSFEKIIIFDQFLDKHDRNQFLGLRASDSVNVNPWEMIEGLPKSVGTGVINPAWWQIHKTTAFKPLSYYEEYGNLQLHTHHHHEGGGSAAPGAKFFEEARSSIPETLEEEAEEDYALDTWQDDIDYDIDFAHPPVGLPDRSPPMLPPSNGGGKGDTPPLILLSPPPLNNNATMAVLTPRSIGGSSQAAFINAILSPPQNLLGGNQVVPPSSSADFSQQQLTPHSTPSNKGASVSPFPKSSQSQTMVMGVTSDGRERLLGRGDEQYPTTNFMISGVDGSHQSLLDRRYNTNTPFPPPPSYTTNTKAGPDRMILTASSQQHMDFMPLGSNSNLLRFGSSQHLIPNRTNLAPYNVGNNPHHPSLGSSYHVTGNGNLIMNEINLLNKPPPPDQISLSNLNPNSTNALTGGTPAVAAATKKTTKPRKKRAPKTTQASTTKGQNKVSGSKQNAASNQSAAAAAAAQQHLEQQNAFLTGSTAAASAQGQASSAAGLMYRMQQQQQRLPSGGNSQSSQNYQRFPPSQFLPPHYLQQQQDAQHAHLQSLKKVPENVSAPSAPTGKKKNAGSNNKSSAVPLNPSAAVASSSQPQMAAAANIYNYEDGGLSSLHHNQSLTGSSTSNMDPKAALSSMLRARNMTGTPGGDISLGPGGGGGGQLYPSNQLQQQQRYTGPPAAIHHSIPPHTPSSVSASTLNYEQQQQQQSSLTHLQQQQQTKYASYHQEETGVGGNNNMQQQQQIQPHLLLKHNTIIPNQQQQQPPPPGYHNHDNNNPNAYPTSFFGNVPQQLMTAQQQQVNNNPQRRQMMMMTTQQQQQAYQQQQQPAGTNLLTNQQQQNLKINIAAAPSDNKAANTKNIFDHFDFDNEENAKVHVPPPPTFQASSSSRLHSNEKQRKVPSQMLLSQQQQQQYQQHSAASYAAKNQQQLIQSTTNYSNNNNNNQMPPQSVRRPPPYSSASTIISTPSSSSSSSLQKAQQDQQQQQYMQQMIQSNSTTASIGGGGPKSMMMTGQQQLLHHSNKNYNPLSSGGAGSSNIYHQHQNPQMINPNSTAQSLQQQQRYPLSQPPGGTNTGISQQQQQMSSGSNWNTAVVPPQSNNYSHNNLISYPGGSSSIRPAPQQFINTQSYNTPYALQSSYRPLASGGSGNSSENLYSQQQQQAMYRYNTMQQQQHLNNTAVIGSTNGGGSGGYPADNAASFQQQQQIPLENQQFSQAQPNSSNSRPTYPGFYGTQTHP